MTNMFCLPKSTVFRVSRQFHPPRILVLVLLVSFAVFAGKTDADATFAASVRSYPRPAGAPKASDVCFSTRWPRPLNATDPHDSLQSARAFHATRLDWLYLSGNVSKDKAFVARAKAQAYLVGGTLNSSLTDKPGTRSYELGRTVNLTGSPLKDPWTTKWGMRFGCPNHPEYATVFLSHARYALDAGVDYFQMDGVQLNAIMMHYGGCFCPHCMAGFQEYLAGHSTPEQRATWGVGKLSIFDYAQFLLDLGNTPDSPVASLKGPVALRRLFEEFQVESGLRFLADMHAEIDRMAGHELAYSCNATREFLTTYHKVHDFAFIEAYPSMEGIPGFLYNERLKKARDLGKAYLFTFVSDDVDHTRRFIATCYALGANVIVHLVATEADRSSPVRLTLDSLRFFGGRPLKMRFLTPPPYDAAAHETAADTGDTLSLVHSNELPGGRVTMVDLPAVTSWGMLVVEPGNDNTGTTARRQPQHGQAAPRAQTPSTGLSFSNSDRAATWLCPSGAGPPTTQVTSPRLSSTNVHSPTARSKRSKQT